MVNTFHGNVQTAFGGAGDRISIAPGRAISFNLASWSEVKIEIYTASGRLVRTLDMVNPKIPEPNSPDRYTIPPGPHTIVWDGRNDLNEPVSGNTLYFCTILTRALSPPTTTDETGKPVKRVTKTRRRGEGPIIAKPEEDRVRTPTGEWVKTTRKLPVSEGAGFTTTEDLIRKTLNPDEVSSLLGETLPNEFLGVPRALLSPCATELVKAELISLNDAYMVCAENYLAMLREKEKDGFDLSNLLKDPMVLATVGGLALLLFIRK